MIFLKLLLLLLGFVAVDADQQSDEYIILATKYWKNDLYYTGFYRMDFELKNEVLLAKSEKDREPPNKLFLVSNELYGHFKNSDEIARLDLSTKTIRSVTIPGVKDMLFVGPDSEDNLYFYSPKSKSFLAYQFGGPTTIKRVMKGLESEDNVHLIGRDQCNKDWVYLLRCSETKNSAFIFDLKKDSIVFEYPNINPSKCFDIWGVSPNGEQIYFLEHITYDDEPRTIIHKITRLTSDRNLTERMEHNIFAPGNDKLFFGYKGYQVEGQEKDCCRFLARIGLDGGELISDVAPARALAIAVHQPSKECWNPKSTS